MEMYKRDPQGTPGTRPIRRGVINHTLMMEDIGRRRVNHGEICVLRFYNRLDESERGEIGCATPGEVRRWIEAFDQAKQQARHDWADYDHSRGQTAREKLKLESEINLAGHRSRVWQYAQQLIRTGQDRFGVEQQIYLPGANFCS